MTKGARLPFRIAAVLLLLFAAGHSAGFLRFRPASPQGLAVLESMRNVSFDFGGRSVHWIDLYNGFGLFASVFLLFSMVIAWRLGDTSPAEAGLARTLAWGLCLTQVANVVLCVTCFGPVQAGFAAACAVTLAWAALRIKPSAAVAAP